MFVGLSCAWGVCSYYEGFDVEQMPCFFIWASVRGFQERGWRDTRQSKRFTLKFVLITHLKLHLCIFFICRCLLNLTLFLLQVLPLLKFMLLAPMAGKKSLSRSLMELLLFTIHKDFEQEIYLLTLFVILNLLSAGSACAHDGHCSSRYSSCWSYSEHLAPDIPIIWL